MQYDFYLDGVSAKSKGIILQGEIEFSPLVPRVQTYAIPGRNGDLHAYEKDSNGNIVYDNRTATATCYVLSENVDETLKTIKDWLFGVQGYRKLQLPEDGENYWEARVVSADERAIRKGMLNPFTVVFDCKPLRSDDEGSGGGEGGGNANISVGERISHNNYYNNWMLVPGGNCIGDNNYKLISYKVIPKSWVWVKALNDYAECKFIWEKATDNVPAAYPNQYLIGEPELLTVDGAMKVPEGADYIIFSVHYDDEITGLYDFNIDM